MVREDTRPALRRGLALGLLVLLACTDRRTDQPHKVQVRPQPTDVPTLTDTSRGATAAAIGPLLLLATPEGSTDVATVIRADAVEDRVGDTTGLSVLLAGQSVDLFSREGLVGTVELSGILRPGSTGPDCPSWPATVVPLAGRRRSDWSIGLLAGRMTALPLDSIAGMSPRDSALWAAGLTALASRLPDDTSRVFRSRPYVVDRAWRVAAPKGDTLPRDSAAAPARGLPVLVAILGRRLNQEDAPREERLVLVVEAPGADPRRWTVGWHERAEGEEDALEVAEPLVAFTPKGVAALHLLFGRDDGEHLHAALLVRTADGWQLTWESARASCR